MSGQKLAVIQPVKAPGPIPKQSAEERKTAKRQAEIARVISQFQSDATEIDSQPEPVMARATLWALASLVVFGITWASVAKIDRIVTARGKIVSIAPNVVVQPLEAAVVRSIDAKVGDVVKAGTALATLDPTFTMADVDQIEARIASLDAFIARLEAEQARRPYRPDANSRFDYGMLQEAIWKERQTQYSAQMRVYDERISRAMANVTSREREREYLASRLKIVREVESMRVELEQSKTGSRLNSLAARDTRIEIERNLSNADNALIENRHEMESINAEREVFQRQWDGKIVEDLVAKRNERDSLTEQLVKARKKQEMVRLETPVDAVVLEVAPRSVGSVIQGAEPFFKLVPLDASLEIEANIQARELGYVAVGDPVQIKIDAYTFQEHGMAEGVVKVISGDSFSETRANADLPPGAYYRARVELSKIELRNVPDNFHLVPGMPLSAEIKIGERSVISYFLRPLLRGFNESMREP